MPSDTVFPALALLALGISLQGCGPPPDNRPRCQEILIADTGNHRILKCVNGLCSQVAGTTGVAGSGENEFNRPVSVAVDFDNNYLVSDYRNKRIQKCPSAGEGACWEVENSGGLTVGMGEPGKVTLLHDGVAKGSYAWNYRTDNRNGGTRVCDAEWVCRSLWPDFLWQQGQAADANGDLFVLDAPNQFVNNLGTVHKYVFSEGAPSFTATSSKVTPTQFENPINMAVDSDGNYLVVEQDGHKVTKCPPDSPDGPCVTVAGQDGRGSGLSQLDSPRDIAVDVANRFYVADSNNNRILLCGESASGYECIDVEGLDGDYELSDPQGVAMGNIVICPERPNATASALDDAYFSTVV